MRSHAATLLAFVLLLTPGAWALAGPAEGGGTQEQLLVGFEPGQQDEVAAAAQLAGGDVRRAHPALRFLVVTSDEPERFRTALAAHPGVSYVERDDETRLAGAQWNGAQWNGVDWNGAEWNGVQWNGAEWNGAQWNGAQWNGAQWNAARFDERVIRGLGQPRVDPGVVWQWGSWSVGAPQAWSSHAGGRAAQLCVLDSGIAWDHRDLRANAWTGPSGERGYNAITGGTDAYDDAGHGTHVAGIAGAAVLDGSGVAGVGNVSLMAAKVLDRTGSGHESDLAFGVAWCADRGADVALMALSVTEKDSPTLQRAFDYAVAKDVLLVASAGNDGCGGCVAYPASDPRVVAVSAIGRDHRKASFSSAGPEVELAAPGVEVLSTFPGDRFVVGSGTSQAAGFVAGAAALVRDREPGLSADATRARLQQTAEDLGAGGRDAAYGHGLVRVDRALGGA